MKTFQYLNELANFMKSCMNIVPLKVPQNLYFYCDSNNVGGILNYMWVRSDFSGTLFTVLNWCTPIDLWKIFNLNGKVIFW